MKNKQNAIFRIGLTWEKGCATIYKNDFEGEKMKRIVTVQDISCVGKCSLTVALPIISALGVECAVIPTAVLSTHKNSSVHTAAGTVTDSHRVPFSPAEPCPVRQTLCAFT